MPISCKEFVQSSEKGASQNLRNSCLKCGRTKEAHGEQSVTIVFGGLQRTYMSTGAAMQDGFYPVSTKREDYLC